MLKVVILSRGAGKQQYGLGNDAKLLESSLKELQKLGKTNCTLCHKDPYMYVGEQYADVNIHLEVPCRAAYPYAKVNVIIPNPEWWYKESWAWVERDASTVFFHKSKHSEALFGNKGSLIGWRCPALDKPVIDKKKIDQVLFIVGGSKNKKAAADIIVESWRPEYNKLIILSSVAGAEKPNVLWIKQFITNEEKQQLLAVSKYHIVASLAEGFGYTMVESIAAGAKILWTDIPVYKELWGGLLGNSGIIKTTTSSDESSCPMLDKPVTFTNQSLFDAMLSLDKQSYMNVNEYVLKMNKDFRQKFTYAWLGVEQRIKRYNDVAVKKPGLVNISPVLGVVTLVYNRPHWFTHALRNIETSSYPKDKIVWVVVDDSEPNNRVDSYIEKTRTALPDLNLVYVSLPKKTPIGSKRNIGCEAAIKANNDVSVFAFMDDDDHYPEDSLKLRISGLSEKIGAVYCATLPMYDTCKYISAMNVPPLDLGPADRVSEATLCFKRIFWEQSRFPKDTNVGEGEGFIKGREHETVELSPKNVIVSFIHNKNLTSRRVPETKEPNGCHYGFSDEYFTMISQLGSA
jgi:hypothetical protein